MNYKIKCKIIYRFYCSSNVFNVLTRIYILSTWNTIIAVFVFQIFWLAQVSEFKRVEKLFEVK